MNQRQPDRERVSPDYAGYHDIEVSEIHEARHAVSLVKRLVDFVFNSRIPGIVVVAALLVAWRIGCAMAEAGDKLTDNALFGALATIVMAFCYGGVGLYLDWKHHAKISQKPPDLAPESRNGRVGTAEAGSSP
jgi:hypothetical protein